jgi:predicted O-methyltransferase YrrM
MKNLKFAVIFAMVLTALTAALVAQGQRGRPFGPGGGPSSLESTWAALAFEVKVSNTTLERLRPQFELAWQEQARAIRESAGNFREFAGRMQKIRDDLNEMLKNVLTAEESRKLADWQASRPQMGPPREAPRGDRPARGPGGSASGPSGKPPLARDDAEKRILEAAEQVTRSASVPQEDGRAIRLLTEAIGARHAVEIGTSTGYSGLWFALALRRTGGKLTTFEIDSGKAATARENFRKGGVEGLVTLTVGDAHKNVERLNGPIDIVFIDADKEGYVDYLEKTLPLVRPGGLILAHNVNMAMVADGYVKRVTSDPELETMFYTDGGGLSVTLKKR